MEDGNRNHSRPLGGPPPKLNKQLVNQIAALIQAGNYYETAAAVVGVSRSTMWRWLREGKRLRDGLELKERKWLELTTFQRHMVRLSGACEEASAQSEALGLQEITNLAKSGHFPALKWKMERRYPARWGPRNQEPQDGDAVEQEAEIQVDPDLMRQVREQILNDDDAIGALRQSALDSDTRAIREDGEPG